MEYIILAIVIIVIILLIIKANTFKATPIKLSRWDTRPKCTKGPDGTIFCDGIEKKLVDKKKLLDSSELSSFSTPCDESETAMGVDVKKDKDYYFLGDPQESQVYHVFNNIYTFEEAKKTCSDRKGRLATPGEMNQTLKNGADWCSWGWTSDGHAYMPNQNPKCNKNTGLLSAKNIDPFLRLGANCFGTPN